MAWKLVARWRAQAARGLRKEGLYCQVVPHEPQNITEFYQGNSEITKPPALPLPRDFFPLPPLLVRAQALEPLLKVLSIKAYLRLHKELSFELGEIYQEMARMKLGRCVPDDGGRL